MTLGLAACGGAGDPARPNVLLVTLDTVRADHLSTYRLGGSLTTPNFDALAAAGVRFDLALSSSAVTPVSHATILTGRYQYNHGLRVLSAGSGYSLPPDQPTLATAFKAAGYATGAVHSAFPVSSWFGFDRDFDHFDSLEGTVQASGDSITWDVGRLQRRADATTEAALAFIEGTSEPWFLWLHYWDPHDAVVLPPQEYLKGVPRNAQGQYQIDALYDRELWFVDRQFGRLVDDLRKRGAWEEVLVAVTSDHGEGLSDGLARHGWANHRILYQEQIHVPLILRLPGVAPGAVVPDLVRTADIAPTLLDYGGVDPPAPLDGASLRPLIEGREEPPRVAYADQVNAYDTNARMVLRRPAAAFLYSVTDPPWKLIWRPHMPGRAELYHLADDPQELTNRAQQEPERVERLLQDLARRNPWVTEAFPDSGDGVDMSAALSVLGYGGSEGDQDATWRWSCFRHPALLREERGRCPRCDAILIPIARR